MTSTIPFPSHIKALKPYVPGLPISDLARRTGMAEQSIAKLASNENPLGPSPKALQALAAKGLDVSLYPDNDCTALTQAIARAHDVPTDWVVIGAGSESLLATTVATVLEVGSKTAYSQYSFQAYVNAAQRIGAVPIVVPSPDFVVDLAGLESSLEQEPALLYIANPGNPTGTCVTPQSLERLLRRVPSTTAVLLDEAYYEFLPEHMRLDAIALVRELPNLLVTRTFSKAYGLAGLRVGYGIAQPEFAEMLRRARAPFTVTEAAQLAAVAALEDHAFLAHTVEHNENVKAMLVQGLRDRGLPVLESHTNFVLARVGNGADLAKRLEPHGLIVRPVGSYGLAEWVRISIGTKEQTERLLHAFQVELG
ncbi:MAG: histidinol-phosphate transaminase [Variovorax paradoxus]|nr:MAG: histidinol-phosphate transaminase [Variovorax paradoxus]PZQ01123.1 MAG: histidinol-phosphate transaminase [Variovorax paradoxus]